MLETLEKWDRQLFLLLNGDGGSFWDMVMIYASEKFFWIPLYVLFLYLIYRYYGWIGTVVTMATVAALITMTDQGSVQLFKFTFERYRPCHNELLQGLFYMPESSGCGGKFGFVSSHAANHFGLAAFLGLALRRAYPSLIHWLFLWAALIGYSRIYLARHYPSDVIGGALLGILIGYLVYRLHRWILLRYRLSPERS